MVFIIRRTMAPLMDDQQVTEVHRAVNTYLRENPGFNLLNPNHFPQLVDEMHRQISFTEDTNPNEIFTSVVAMCAVGPERSSPPGKIVQEYLKTFKDNSVAGIDRVVEIAVAYGCGKWRDIASEGDPWCRQWARALSVMIKGIESAVRESNVWLSTRVVGYPEASFWNSEDGRDAVYRDAALLALYMINSQSLNPLHISNKGVLDIICESDGTTIKVKDLNYEQYLPPGARAVFEINGSACLKKLSETGNEGERSFNKGTQINILAQDVAAEIKFTGSIKQISLKIGESAMIADPIDISWWECCCGNKNCATRHRLDAWLPSTKINLWSFLASAVKGPESVFKVNTFVTGMYYPLLVKEGAVSSMRIRKVPVEYKYCSNKDCTNPDPLRKYEGSRCSCKKPYDPEKTLRRTEDRFIAIMDYPIYQRQERTRCNAEVVRNDKNEKCDNLYNGSCCPLSHCNVEPKLKRPTYVWVRTYSKRVPLEVFEEDERLWIEQPLEEDGGS